MENSETQKRVINLGKMLVEEINLGSESDTLSLWMAHFIAEQISIVENATGDERCEAEKRCFDTILKFWQHRAFFPRGQRPFDDFEPVFRALARLDAESRPSYFFAEPDSRSKGSENFGKEDDVQEWLDIAKGVDRTARIFIEYAFRQAALNAIDEKTLTWIMNSINLLRSDDISIIVHLTDINKEAGDNENIEQEMQAKQEKIESRIEQLDAFVGFSQNLREIFSNELENIKKGSSSTDAL
jgi:hypothetical protein